MSEDSSSKQEPDLAAIEARLKAATPGPWEFDELGYVGPIIKRNNSPYPDPIIKVGYSRNDDAWVDIDDDNAQFIEQALHGEG
jgi:hypothetical protein